MSVGAGEDRMQAQAVISVKKSKTNCLIYFGLTAYRNLQSGSGRLAIGAVGQPAAITCAAVCGEAVGRAVGRKK